MNISEEESFRKSVLETMRKFGFVYADINRRKIQMKADFYETQGFKTKIAVILNGFQLQVR
jgi:hypothetical protein